MPAKKKAATIVKSKKKRALKIEDKENLVKV
jgi:hypothetical protein